VPWCDTCDRFLSPSTVVADGTCPTCGRTVDPGSGHSAVAEAVDASDARDGGGDEEDFGPIPWHLKLLAGALAVYLGYRAYQGIEWVAHQF
jgi:hypothetical protein